MASGITIYYNDAVAMSDGIEEIKESITRILLTNRGERVNNPDFGADIQALLFENYLTIDGELENKIYLAISRWEPRVMVNKINIDKSVQYTVKVSITFVVKETGQEVGLEYGFTE